MTADIGFSCASLGSRVLRRGGTLLMSRFDTGHFAANLARLSRMPDCVIVVAIADNIPADAAA